MTVSSTTLQCEKFSYRNEIVEKIAAEELPAYPGILIDPPENDKIPKIFSD